MPASRPEIVPTVVGTACPGCGSIIRQTDGEAPEHGHFPMTIFYACHRCGEEWTDVWCAAVDADCPNCAAHNTAIDWTRFESWPPPATAHEALAREARRRDPSD